MFGDIVDFVTNNWGSLLGFGPANAAPGATPQGYGGGPVPPPPPAPSAPQFSPSGVADVNPYTGQPRNAAFGPQGGPQDAMFMGPPAGSTGTPNTTWSLPGGGGAGSAQAATLLPGDRGPMMGASQGFGGGSPTQTASTSQGPAPVPQAGQPLDILAGQSPPPPQGPPGPQPTTQGSLEAALGLGQPGMLRLFAGGLGRGLENAGRLPRGASKGQAFAAGAGGGLVGANAAADFQTQQQAQLQNQLFNQRSIAWKDWLAGVHTGNESEVAAARAQYLLNNDAYHRAGNRDVFSGTEYAKSRDLERSLDQEDERIRKQMNDLIHADASGSTIVDKDLIKRRYDNLQKELDNREGRRKEAAARRGIKNPDAYLSGSDNKHAFDATNLTKEQIAHIPENAIYKYKDADGNEVYKIRDYDKQPPYPGWQRQTGDQGPGAQQPQQQGASLNDALYGDQQQRQSAEPEQAA